MNINLDELDLNNIGSWPKPIKLGVLALTAVIILAAGLYYDTRTQMRELASLKQQEVNLRKTFEVKQQRAVNLRTYEVQLKEMKETYGELLRQLPERTEVPGLVEDISHQGLASGLEFKSIKLLPEREKDFYAELTIDIIVRGNYHQLGEFVSHIANLPRIVTLHDFTLKHDGTKDNQNLLTMNIKAKTYRYLGDET